MTEVNVTQEMVDQLVAPEHQYLDADDPPLESLQMAWPLLKKGGFMVFDDYAWKPPGFTLLQRPKVAVDAFINMFEDELQMTHLGYQLIVRKLK